VGTRRRQDLPHLLRGLNPQIGQLDEAIDRATQQDPRSRLLMTQPGVGPITALAYVLTMGDVHRLRRGKQVASYLGLIPTERSSSNRRRLGSISKQGSPFLRIFGALCPLQPSSSHVLAKSSRSPCV
jgi:transposase